jgi:AraC family transcriptional regulator of adaptative response/methylated-DNA-[protein]-cysteine methyltransferase
VGDFVLNFSKGKFMKIRKATLKDIEALTKLLGELFAQEVEFTPDEKSQQKGLRKIIKDKNVGHIFVATKEGKLIAMTNLLYTTSTALGGKVGIIEDVIVAFEHRGKGIGKAILEHVIEYAKRKKLKRITLFTDEDNFQAQDFYQALGFQRSSMVQFKKTLVE